MRLSLPAWERIRRGIGLAITLAAVGCHTQIRFDDHSVDAGVMAPEASSAPADTSRIPDTTTSASDAGACQGVRCGYEVESCSADHCELECPQRGNCTGICGPHCTTDCEEDSQCTLVTGNDARIRCEPGARCLLTLGIAGEGRCEEGSRCDIQCLGVCALLCDQGATCAYACSANAPLVPFSGHASCP